MGNVRLITGHGGTEHVTAEDVGAMHAGLAGKERYVLDVGRKFEAAVVSNNLIKIYDGEAMNQGRHIRIAPDTYEEAVIDNGLQAVKRHDIIALKYIHNPDTLVDSATLVVYKGISGTVPIDPGTDQGYVQGDILDGEYVDTMPLYRVVLDGLTITAVEPMFNLLTSMADMKETLNALNKEKEKLLPVLGSQYIDFVMSNKAIYGGASIVSTSTYLPKGYTMKLNSAVAVGASGDFASHFNLQKFGNFWRLETTNVNLIGHMIQAGVTVQAM